MRTGADVAGVFICLACSIVTACASPATGSRFDAEAPAAKDGFVAADAGAAGRSAQNGSDTDASSLAFNPPSDSSTNRMLVYRGTIAVEVARPDEAIRAFLDQVRQWGGYLADQSNRTLTVRLPALQFDVAFEELKKMGRVLNESRKANDVTEEFVDLGIRLENAKRSRERLLALLERADKVEDILKIEEQLGRLTEEIERMEGRRKFLADQVAMATLQVTFEAIAAPSQGPRRKPSRFEWINHIGVENVLRDF